VKALVVDDSAMTRMVVKKTLASLGATEVAEAADGAAALEIIRGGDVGVIFSDWNMPVMTGFELLKAVREIDKAVPFIMITTEGSREKIVDAITHGVSDYLVKPFTPVQVREKVAKWSAAVGATA
jgi:two-component system chemotaxis response regulator CheY